MFTFHEKISYQGQLYHGAALSLNIYLPWSSIYKEPQEINTKLATSQKNIQMI